MANNQLQNNTEGDDIPVIDESTYCILSQKDMADNMDVLRSAVCAAEKKLHILEDIRNLLEERGEDKSLLTLFSALLDQASEIKIEAQKLTEELAALEDELSDAIWVQQA